MKRFFRNNGLPLVLLVMFLVTLLAEAEGIRDPGLFHGGRQADPGGVSVSRGPFPQTPPTPKPDH